MGRNRVNDKDRGWGFTALDWVLTALVLAGLSVPAFLGRYSFWYPILFVVVMVLFGLVQHWIMPEFGRRKK
jgi:hypothetical protein